jgi:REP element-mobilizing transposase RayT
MFELETMPDHVHLVEVDPQFGVQELVKAIKARVLREELPC